MPVGPGTLIVIALYVMVLYVVWYVAPRLPGAEAEPPRPWWRSTRFWATVVAVTQIVTYVIFS